MNLECGRAEVVWRNIVVECQDKRCTSIVVNRVQGRIEPSTMTALVGVSGSGKTTILNAIVGRSKEGLRISGEVFLNGHLVDPDVWEDIVGFSCKHFHAYETQTVGETLRFAMEMAMYGSETGESIEKEISRLGHMLGLSRVMDTPVRSISAGERARLSLGVVLVRKPLVLIIDEFASNLDIFNIIHVLKILRILRGQGKSILVSLQRPSQKMLSFFDRMMLVCQGEIVFNGRPEHCVDFFRTLGYDPADNPDVPDFFMETLSVDTTTAELERASLERINRFKNHWRQIEPPAISAIIEKIERPVVLDFGVLKFAILLRRNLSDFVRKVEFVRILGIQKLTTLVLLILIYLRLEYSQKGIRDRFGILSFMVIYFFEKTESNAAIMFESHKKAIKREVCSGMYGAVSSYFASLLSSFCTTGAPNILYTAVVYWAVGLNPNFWRFVFFIFVLILISFLSISLAIVVSLYTKTLIQSQVLAATILTAFVIFGGNFVNPDTIPGFIRWIIWVSPVYYALEAMLQDQFRGLAFDCGDSDEPCYPTGSAALDFYGLNRIGYRKSVTVLLLITVALVLVGAVSMRNRIKPRVVP